MLTVMVEHAWKCFKSNVFTVLRCWNLIFSLLYFVYSVNSNLKWTCRCILWTGLLNFTAEIKQRHLKSKLSGQSGWLEPQRCLLQLHLAVPPLIRSFSWLCPPPRHPGKLNWNASLSGCTPPSSIPLGETLTWANRGSAAGSGSGGCITQNLIQVFTFIGYCLILISVYAMANTVA